MAKRFVKISLATKLRLVYGVALLGIIMAALVLPWYFTELRADQGLQGRARDITDLSYNEFVRQHVKNGMAPENSMETMVALYQGDSAKTIREGPLFVSLADTHPQRTIDGARRQAAKILEHAPDQDVYLVRAEDKRAKPVFRCFKPVRSGPSCAACHGSDNQTQAHFTNGQLVGLIEIVMPASAAAGPLVWWTRISFLAGGVVAALVALVLFAIITQRLILRPVRHLRRMADKVAEGDMSVRSTVKTGDELQRLGESFNDMLTAIADQHEKLRSANRALDQKLGELAEANVTLYKANQVKNEFLANVSHELRTPLNSIIGFADLVGDAGAGDDDRTKRYAQNIVSSSKHLLAMINDILDLAKIEAGKAEVRFDKVNVTDTCQTLLTLLQPLADKKQLTLRAQLADDVPLVNTDGGKLQQVLYNLLSNAIKFTPPGGQVTLSTLKESISRDGQIYDEISVSVADTGPGIAEGDQQAIFEKFHRLDQSLTRESSGTGLGLAISKELTSLIGGRLTVQSEPGHGATFILFLPAQPRQNDVYQAKG